MRRHLTVLALVATAFGTAGTGLAVQWLASGSTGRGVAGSAARAPAAGPPAAWPGTAVAATRPRRPFDAAALRAALRSYLGARPGTVGVMAADLRTGASFGENERGGFVAASVMKVDVLAGLLLRRQAAGLGLAPAERDLAGRMIRESDNHAADVLYAAAGRAPGLARANLALGLRQTTPFPVSWGSSLTSPADQVRLLRRLATSASPLRPPARGYVLGLMETVLPQQAWGVGTAALPGERIALKNGWTPVRHQGHGWTVNSVGRITGPGHDLLLAVLSGGSPTMEAGIATVETTAAMVAAALRH